MPRSILRLALVAGMGCLIAVTQVASVALADHELDELQAVARELYDAKKKSSLRISRNSRGKG